MLARTLSTLTALALSSSVVHGASLAEDLRKNWAQQKGLLQMTAAAMPEESFSSKPTPEQRSFGEQILHVAGANSFLMRFTGTDVELAEVDLSNLSTFGIEASTKEEILAALERSFEIGGSALAGFDDEAMLEEVQGPPWVGTVTRAGMVNFILGHNMDIYGQMAVYLRLEGVVPPASRGR
ncbi:MAG: DinB family protein [Acidobacteriota bacterium]|nr:DinB family protein [Acidobacteriota bacterium]